MAHTVSLQMDSSLAQKYTSASQKTRVVTETWVGKNMFCPRCGNLHINHYINNKPVADFYCLRCENQFELKSKDGDSLEKISNGAYSTMIDRITGMNNPDFFFMSYSKANWTVKDFFFIPKHFFTPEIIEKRKPLALTARRAGWVGCNILLSKIPNAGRIRIIENGVLLDRRSIVERVKKADNLMVSDIEARGWLLDVLSCVERIQNTSFILSQIYAFEDELSTKHPNNNNVRAKIRQQLQLLRDKGVIEFIRPGEYRKVD